MFTSLFRGEVDDGGSFFTGLKLERQREMMGKSRVTEGKALNGDGLSAGVGDFEYLLSGLSDIGLWERKRGGVKDETVL